MKNLKTYEQFSENRLNETGEWNRNIDWQYVKDNPDANDECSEWIKSLETDLNDIKDMLNDSNRLEIINIKGFDMYQGPYASVKIDGKPYQIWYISNNELYIILN